MNRIAAALLIVVSAIACVSVGCEKKDSPDKRPIVVGYLPIIAHLPAAVAREQQKLDDLDVEFRVFGTSNDLMSALAGGDIDIATTVALAPVVRVLTDPGFSGHEPPVLVFSYSRTTSANPFDGVFVKSDSDVTGLGDLADKKIGVFPGTTAKNIMGYLLRRDFDVDSTSIEWVYLPPDVQLARLEEGDIDALYTYETTRTKAEARGLRQLHGSVVASVLEGAPYGCSAVNSSFAEANPELVRAFVDAFDDGVRQVFENESEARRVLQAKLGVPAEIAQRCNLEQRVTSTELASDTNLSLLVEFIEVLKTAGELSSDVDSHELARSMLWHR